MKTESWATDKQERLEKNNQIKKNTL